MDIFGVLNAISRKKDDLARTGMNENEALMSAMRDISGEYHVSLPDIKKLVG